jgi:hypothetical protein
LHHRLMRRQMIFLSESLSLRVRVRAKRDAHVWRKGLLSRAGHTFTPAPLPGGEGLTCAARLIFSWRRHHSPDNDGLSPRMWLFSLPTCRR